MWKDSRLHKPTSNHYDRYPVVFLYCGSTFTGYASWMPKNGYTDGDWIEITCTNGNKLSESEVLYWMELPKKPELAK